MVIAVWIGLKTEPITKALDDFYEDKKMKTR